MNTYLSDKKIIPGAVWRDTKGDFIQAHGGGVLFHEGTYYWYGENKSHFSRSLHELVGVSCYSSSELVEWNNEGVVLPAVSDNPAHDLYIHRVLERPKVIYNELTKHFVMWMHVESEDYSYARAGVAISKSPTGPFQYLGSLRPNGAMSRDMTLFKDTDGSAYHICSSEDNSTMYITRLTDDYLEPTKQYTRNFVQKYREAPALFKYNEKYFMITSACTGWSPNEAKYAVADNIMGPWRTKGNPCEGMDAHTTFHSQSTYILPIEGKTGAFVFMADRWKSEKLEDSRYIWLPFQMNDETVTLKWVDEWAPLSYFDRVP